MALSGTEVIYVVPVQSNGMLGAVFQQTTTAAIASLGIPSSNSMITTISTVGGTTIPAVAIYGKIVNRSGTQTAAFTDTTDTAANIIAIIPNATVGQSFRVTFENNTMFSQTLAGGSGVTLAGNMILTPYTWVEALIQYTGANAITITAIEAGNFINLPGTQFTAIATNTPLSFTGAQIGGATDVSINLTAALAAAGTATLPTVANLVAAIPNAVPGLGYNLRIINSSSGAFAWTVATNTGWTLTGTMSIAQNTFRDFVVTLNSLTTATLQQVGTGTTS